VHRGILGTTDQTMEGNENDGATEWSCCNDSQSLFFLLYIAFFALSVALGKSILLKPMRLMTVFIHEMSHALACWLTCGSVLQLEVHENEGGVTRYVGGCRCLIIPAGYIGASFFGMLFVILSGGRKTATFAAAMFTFALLISLCYRPNRTLVYLCLGYAIFTSLFIYVEWKLYSPIIQFLILFYGVVTSSFALSDIYNDTILRSVQGSDAYACSQEVSICCSPRFVGLQWAMWAILIQIFGVWIAIVEMSDECEELGWFECIHLTIDIQDFEFGKNRWDLDRFWGH
jgi:Peptidase M50B-like